MSELYLCLTWPSILIKVSPVPSITIASLENLLLSRPDLRPPSTTYPTNSAKVYGIVPKKNSTWFSQAKPALTNTCHTLSLG